MVSGELKPSAMERNNLLGVLTPKRKLWRCTNELWLAIEGGIPLVVQRQPVRTEYVHGNEGVGKSFTIDETHAALAWTTELFTVQKIELVRVFWSTET